MEIHEIKVIARIRSDFKTKFGIPRQSGLVDELVAGGMSKKAAKDYVKDLQKQLGI